MLNIMREEREYWLSMIGHKNRLLSRVAWNKLRKINSLIVKFSRLPKSDDPKCGILKRT